MAMMMECVPNFSEGRDRAKVEAIVAAMHREGVWVLKYEMDADHNRSVVTLAGEPEALLEAVLAGIGKAAELIDLRTHEGAHPRLGATDVVPFIPMEGATLEDCVRLARRLGERVWERYQIPVYFYEAAATRPERVNLADVRRGQFEGIRDAIASDEARRPDVGERRLHESAGAVIIGARKFLVAYNIYLATSNVEVAKKVAKAVRFASGGLRAVKAMGLEVRGKAQVSMNLVDTELTPIARVFELVKREAARYGVAVESSEIVGLVPKRALEEAAEWFLQIENFDSSMVLENRLAAAMRETGAKSAGDGSLRAGVEPFLERLAAATATPGGGSAGAAAGAMAAALGVMVAGMSRGKRDYLAFDKELGESIARLQELGEELRAAIDGDAASYRVVLEAYKAKRNARPETAMASELTVGKALRGAAEVPLRVAECSAEVVKLLGCLRSKTNPVATSDLKAGISLARAAVAAAISNVEVNLESIAVGVEAEFQQQARHKVVELKQALR